MGGLHDGHFSLVRLAKKSADRVVVTLFVNPTQFGEGEDYETYPRSLERDTRCLRDAGVDILFIPETKTIYPFGVARASRIIVPGLTDECCGAGRPGHFDGVTSVVLRLFALVQPDLAVFGQKDYQQLLVIRHMVEDIGLPVEIVTGPTIREASGLAMSSRNAYLSDGAREVAPRLHQVLRVTADELQAGERGLEELEARALLQLTEAGFSPEYLAIRDSSNLDVPGMKCNDYVVLAAARIDDVRLIDNVLVTTA